MRIKKIVIAALLFSFALTLSAFTLKPKLPLIVYEGKSRHELFFYTPTCWVGDILSFTFDNYSREQPKTNKFCMKFKYYPKRTSIFGWAGIYWTFPGYNWGNINGGIDLRGATRVTFWARSNLRTAYATFTFGGGYGTYSDTASVNLGVIEISRKWKQYSINLSGQDLSFITRGLAMIIRKKDYSGEAIMRIRDPEIIIYLDDIKFE